MTHPIYNNKSYKWYQNPQLWISLFMQVPQKGHTRPQFHQHGRSTHNCGHHLYKSHKSGIRIHNSGNHFLWKRQKIMWRETSTIKMEQSTVRGRERDDDYFSTFPFTFLGALNLARLQQAFFLTETKGKSRERSLRILQSSFGQIMPTLAVHTGMCFIWHHALQKNL